MRTKRSVLVVGAGVFGVTAALELARRGYDTTVIDPGPIPHQRAASTDISKVIRMDYGSDELYLSMMEEAFSIWDQWNRQWPQHLYHEDGFLLLTQNEMKPGEFEYESFKALERRGYRLERVNREILMSRYPAWKADRYQDGYFNPRGGWAASAKVLRHLAAEAVDTGVKLRLDVSAMKLVDDSSHVCGIIADDGNHYSADVTILSSGAWSPLLSARLAQVVTYIAQPVFHFRPQHAQLFAGRNFPVWSADMSKTGWYGFPTNSDGIVKIANHGAGRISHPDAPRATTREEEVKCRNFLRESLPSLADAPIAESRTCFYADSWDGNFYVDFDPERPGLVYATGGSGHAFKFTPVLGKLVADVVEGKHNPYAARFAWRPRGPLAAGEHARHLG